MVKTFGEMFVRCKNALSYFFKASLIFVVLILAGWKTGGDEEGWKWIQRCLLQSYNYLADNNLKKWELNVTPDGFFRLRKYFPSGKQEYFSFHFTRLKDVEYVGSPGGGDIIFNTVEDDIIVQTYNDPQGNVDSMSTILKVPVSSMEPSRVDSLRQALFMFKH